jgi:hypothetical protein
MEVSQVKYLESEILTGVSDALSSAAGHRVVYYESMYRKLKIKPI